MTPLCEDLLLTVKETHYFLNKLRYLFSLTRRNITRVLITNVPCLLSQIDATIGTIEIRSTTSKEKVMYLKIVWVLAFVCLLGAVSGVAQDPLKVEPAHYRLAFENEHVQVVYIHYGPHEKSSLHDHPPGVVVNLTNGHLRFSDQNGSVQEVRATHGEARWFPAFRHRVENLSDTTYDGVYIAVKHAGTAVTTTPKSATPAMDEETQGIVNAFVLIAKMSNEESYKKH